ncbi:MAG TPA: hypothetical protein VLX68_05310 [Chitinivibrionales bacterium]|nr:hypothetical protein [Chitinivibrionales bacterium]
MQTTLEVVPGRHVNVTVSIDGPNGIRALLVTHLDAGHVFFIDLLSNVSDRILYYSGLAAYMVNLAIQTIRPMYARPQEVLLFGRVAHDDGALETGIDFWKRFGASFIVFKDDAVAQLCGSLSDLHTVDDGLMMGEFPQLVPLDAFSRAQTPSCSPVNAVVFAGKK